MAIGLPSHTCAQLLDHPHMTLQDRLLSRQHVIQGPVLQSRRQFVASGWLEILSCRAMPRRNLKQLQQLAQANAAAGGDQAQAGAGTKGTQATKPAAAKDAKVRR